MRIFKVLKPFVAPDEMTGASLGLIRQRIYVKRGDILSLDIECTGKHLCRLEVNSQGRICLGTKTLELMKFQGYLEERN